MRGLCRSATSEACHNGSRQAQAFISAQQERARRPHSATIQRSSIPRGPRSERPDCPHNARRHLDPVLSLRADQWKACRLTPESCDPRAAKAEVGQNRAAVPLASEAESEIEADHRLPTIRRRRSDCHRCPAFLAHCVTDLRAHRVEGHKRVELCEADNAIVPLRINLEGCELRPQRDLFRDRNRALPARGNRRRCCFASCMAKLNRSIICWILPSNLRHFRERDAPRLRSGHRQHARQEIERKDIVVDCK